MNRNELRERIRWLQNDLKHVQSIAPNCTNCESFTNGFNEHACKQYGPVPADFIQVGCDNWNYDEIPF